MPTRRHVNLFITAGSILFILFISTSYLSIIFPFNLVRNQWWQSLLTRHAREPPPRIYLPKARIAPEMRKFSSKAIENIIHDVTERMIDQDLANMFENCFPNTLDTTIAWHDPNSDYPRTFVVTGDIPAMWIRDSTNQLLPYLAFAPSDQALQNLILGAVNIQASQLLYDPYANAFLPPEDAPIHMDGDMPSRSDEVYPLYDPQRVWESKYELDSLAAFLKLSYEYWRVTEDKSLAKNNMWFDAVKKVFKTIEDQMSGTWEEKKGKENYRFTRSTRRSSETLANDGIGGVVKKCGLVKSQFRPSDDATMLPYLIPANAMTSVALLHLSEMLAALSRYSEHPSALLNLSTRALRVSKTIRKAIHTHGVFKHHKYGDVFAYEVDCYGSHLFMDDANIPSLLALPYLGFVSRHDPVYFNTRRLVLSKGNPWFFSGTMGEGVGGPHVSRDMIWPMGMLVRVITSEDEDEIVDVLEMVKRTTNGTGFMHESFHVDNPGQYTRPWFSWANTLFGETILRIAHERPHLLFKREHWKWNIKEVGSQPKEPDW